MKKLYRTLIILLGFGVGPMIVGIVEYIIARAGIIGLRDVFTPLGVLIIYFSSGILTGIIFIILSKRLSQSLMNFVVSTERKIDKLPSGIILSGTIGLLIGLLMSYLLSGLINSIPISWLSIAISVITYATLCYISTGIAIRRRADIQLFKFGRSKKTNKEVSNNKTTGIPPKIFDTSVIIDGRIFDLCQTGFIEGPIIIPRFILEELQHIADSDDALKRKRGRRGLDIISRVQKELKLKVSIIDKDYDDISETDSKLIKLALELKGQVLTNDYNLNKVASVSGVKVLNINELSNAIKPAYIPGEEMDVQVVKEGKEQGQGIAYLDDGTMIVIENGNGKTGEHIRVVVTSVLQTAAGRMIFAKCEEAYL
ncbi:MAG: TRAM domain-containing protein [Eubacteriales bacterium]